MRTTARPRQTPNQYDLHDDPPLTGGKRMHWQQQKAAPKAKARVKAKHHKSLKKSR